ncbi:MAG: GNAT family protein [Alistipes dispar]
MNLEGRIVRLRAVEPEDAELLYAWENDTSVWSVSGTTEPFLRAQMERFIAAQLQGGDLFRTGQLRLIVETRAEARPVGIADLFEFDPLNRRAGLGILIHNEDDRGRGYASDTVETLCGYARERLRLHQLWCNVGTDNAASLGLFRRTGFVPAGIKRQWLWTPEGYRDEMLMQKILE